MPMLWNLSDMITWREEHGLQEPGDLNHAPGVFVAEVSIDTEDPRCHRW